MATQNKTGLTVMTPSTSNCNPKVKKTGLTLVPSLDEILSMKGLVFKELSVNAAEVAIPQPLNFLNIGRDKGTYATVSLIGVSDIFTPERSSFYKNWTRPDYTPSTSCFRPTLTSKIFFPWLPQFYETRNTICIDVYAVGLFVDQLIGFVKIPIKKLEVDGFDDKNMEFTYMIYSGSNERESTGVVGMSSVKTIQKKDMDSHYEELKRFFSHRVRYPGGLSQISSLFGFFTLLFFPLMPTTHEQHPLL